MAVPVDGFGKKLTEIFVWLNQNAGRGCHGQNTDSVLPNRDAIAFYFRDPGLIVPFLERFDLQLEEPAAEHCGEGSFKLMANPPTRSP